jgi:thiol peroxidase
MADGRTNEVTMKGNPVTLAGTTPKVGDKAPAFDCVGAGLSMVTLADTSGKARLFSVVPSLDTPVCNIQTKKFATELNSLGDKIAAYTVSTDLPFAMARFCGEAKITNMANLSDCHDHSFGNHYGVLITDLPVPLLARAIFVVDPKDTITYVELVPEIATEPNYEAALTALKAAAGA